MQKRIIIAIVGKRPLRLHPKCPILRTCTSRTVPFEHRRPTLAFCSTRKATSSRSWQSARRVHP